MSNFRILITGSRTWTDIDQLQRELGEYYDRNVPITLVSGACPTGADRMAEDYATLCGWEIERHPAEWTLYGKRAGYVRNAEMVALGANVCLAFIKNHSKGATMTTELAIKAGIETHIFNAFGL